MANTIKFAVLDEMFNTLHKYQNQLADAKEKAKQTKTAQCADVASSYERDQQKMLTDIIAGQQRSIELYLTEHT